MKRGVRALYTALLLSGVLGAAPTHAAGGDAETRAGMAPIFDAMSYLLPESLAENGFEDPAKRERIRAALRTLALGAERIERHGARRDPSFAVLSRSLARDAREIEGRFEVGALRSTRFRVQEMAGTCIACHSRLPSARDAQLSERFAQTSRVGELPPLERAKLEYAVRQFDRAVDTYEALLASPEVSPDTLDMMGYVDDYLELSLRVRGDTERPAAALAAFGERPDLSPELRANVASWVRSLRALGAREPLEDPLAEGRALLEVAGDRARFPSPRSALVYYTQASGVLYRLVASRPDPPVALAEALFHLGWIESQVGLSFGGSQTEALLETSIRLDPGGPFADDAYATLEDFVVAMHSGSAGTFVPEERQRDLTELGALIRASREGSEGS